MPAHLVTLLLAASLVALPTAAAAESSISFPPPEIVGEIAAGTYDEAGSFVGDAEMSLAHLDDGKLRLEARSGIEGSAQADVRADFVPIEGSDRLRLVSQRSESRDEEGRSLGVMTIDHERGVATCAPPQASGEKAVEIDLPTRDRVVNIPLNLLFEPLVRGETTDVRFQLLLCRVQGGRLVDARARVAEDGDAESGLVEIRYDLDLGPILSRLAAPFLPRLSFWFDGSTPGSWVGHRMPLFTKGPTVFVVRAGFTPALLGIGE